MNKNFTKDMTFNKVVLGMLVLIFLTGFFLFINTRNKDQSADENIVTQTEETIIEETKDYKIDVAYPVISNNDMISKYVLDTVNAFRADASNPERFIPDSACHQYELDGKYKKVTSLVKGTTSYIYSMYGFTCGAHGATGITTFNFKADGTRILSEDMFIDDNNKMIELTQKILRPKLLKELAENSNISESEYPANMLDDGLGLSCLDENNVFVKEKCWTPVFLYSSNLKEFYITDEGIIFIYGQYQVAPYSSGITEILVSYEEIGPYLK
ncbi:MAG: RsiV family protein [Candidatus Paceibacterota bacterium]